MGSIATKGGGPTKCRRLTLPSKGRPQAGSAHLWPPLMSNVRPANAEVRLGAERRVHHGRTPASCGVRSLRFQLRVERFEVKSSLRDGSPNRHALRHVKHKQSLPAATRCRAKQNPEVLSPWHAPFPSPLSGPSPCIRRRPCPPEITERTVHDPNNRQGTLAPSSPGKLRFCAILVASCGSVLHTVVFHERCRVAAAGWFHRSMSAVSRRAACAKPRV